MRHAVLHSIAQNMAASLAGAHSPMTGLFGIDPFAGMEAAEGGGTVIDLLSGQVESPDALPEVQLLARAAARAFPDLCCKRGVAPDAFVTCTLQFLRAGAACCIVVRVTDRAGRSSSRHYDRDGRRVPSL